jgi:O-antigen/teichoic acid export membrane protein
MPPGDGTDESQASSEHARGGVSEWARSVISGSALFFVAQVIGNLGFFIAVLLLARALSPAERGTVAFITVLAVVLSRLLGVGMRQATTVFAAQRVDERPSLLSNLVVFNVAAAVFGGLVACSVLLALEEHLPEGVGTTEIALIGAGLLVMALLDCGYSFLLGCQRFRERALIIATAPWGWALLVVVVWGPGLTVARAALVWVISQGFSAATVLFASHRGIGFGRLSWPLLRESVGFGLRAWPGQLAGFLNFRLDQILMGFLAAEAALGFYAVAVNASEVLILLPGALTTALLPVISRTEAGDRKDRVLRVFRSLAIVTPLTVVVAALLGPVVIPAVFGSAYEDAVVPFLWLLPGALGFAALAVFGTALTGASSPGWASLGSTVSLLVGIVLDFALIPPFGAAGAAAAASAAYISGGAAAAWAYRTRDPFRVAELLPRGDDLALLRSMTGRLLRRISPARARG